MQSKGFLSNLNSPESKKSLIKYERVKELKILLIAQFITTLLSITLIIIGIAFGTNSVSSAVLFATIGIFAVSWISVIIITLLLISKRKIGSNQYLLKDIRKQTYVNAILFTPFAFPMIFTNYQYKMSGYTTDELRIILKNYLVLEFDSLIHNNANDKINADKAINKINMFIKNGVITKTAGCVFIVEILLKNGTLSNEFEKRIIKNIDKAVAYQFI